MKDAPSCHQMRQLKSGNQTSEPHQEIGPHIYIRKWDITSTSGNRTSHPDNNSDIISTSGNRSSHPHHKIGHHIHIRKLDLIHIRNQTSDSHQEIGPHIHTSGTQTSRPHQET
ncbi:hypothetical protein V5799_034248 [Amblyomma americanum]|uniref:Uncharacterized protein n=1 Tax=Amblyomma americanum TaxID=6943 RepID=A0AAQ4DL02_AMBAM